jgi:hypothetical protein
MGGEFNMEWETLLTTEYLGIQELSRTDPHVRKLSEMMRND